jgi:hypothetical protein
LIEIKGQFVFRASIGGIVDFINLTDLVSFEVEESSGNTPATFKIDFFTDNDTIIKLMNEGNPLEVQFGEDSNNLEPTSLYFTDFDITTNGDRTRYSGNGFATEMDYFINTKSFISSKKSGVEVIRERFFGVKRFNIDKSQDEQVWIQHGITDRQFINNLLAHSYIPNSFLLSAILSAPQLIVKDAAKEIKDKEDNPDWIFSISDRGNNVVPYAGDFALSVNSGLMNNLVGYGREKFIYNIEQGTSSALNVLPKPILSIVKNLAKKQKIEKKYTGTTIINENIHSNYHKAYLNFLVNSVILNTITVEASFGDKFRRIKPLDVVLFKDRARSNKTTTNDFTTGLYFVSKVRRTIQNADLTISVTLNRESFNRVQTS